MNDILKSYTDSVLQNVPEVPYTPPHAQEGFSRTKSNLGVLFSGGLDSTILAKLAAQSVPEDRTIDLYNISFYAQESDRFKVMTFDRDCALNSYRDLEAMHPGMFNLILVGRIYDEVYLKASNQPGDEHQLKKLAEINLNLRELEQEELAY